MKNTNLRSPVINAIKPWAIVLGLLALVETGYYLFREFEGYKPQDEARLASESYSRSTNNLENID